MKEAQDMMELGIISRFTSIPPRKEHQDTQPFAEIGSEGWQLKGLEALKPGRTETPAALGVWKQHTPADLSCLKELVIWHRHIFQLLISQTVKEFAACWQGVSSSLQLPEKMEIKASGKILFHGCPWLTENN